MQRHPRSRNHRNIAAQLTQNKSTRRNKNAYVISTSQQLSGTNYKPDDKSESDGTHHSTQSHLYSLLEL